MSTTKKSSAVMRPTQKVSSIQPQSGVLGDITGRVANRVNLQQPAGVVQKRKARTSPKDKLQLLEKSSGLKAYPVATVHSTHVVECSKALRDEWVARCQIDARYAIPYEPMESKHAEITEKMRCVLLHWLGLVCVEHELQTRTYQTACCYVDRFLHKSPTAVHKEHFQLLGATALMLASKVHEICPIEVSKLAALTCGACYEEEIVLMETHMCQLLEWKLTPMTTSEWISFYLSVLPGNAFEFSENIRVAAQHVTTVLNTSEQREYYKKAMEIINVLMLLPDSRGILPRVVAFAAISWVLPPCSLQVLQSNLRTELFAEDSEYRVEPELYQHIYNVCTVMDTTIQKPWIDQHMQNDEFRVGIHSCSFNGDSSEILDIYTQLYE
eukprot:CFRG6642T1